MGKEQLTKDILIKWFEKGCKAKSDYWIGAEHEKFVFDLSDYRPIPYISDPDGGSVSRLLALLCTSGWQEVKEGANTVALKHDDGRAITLEPSGQLELSGALRRNLHEVCKETTNHLCTAVAAGDKLGIGFLGIGFAPEWTLAEMPLMPKKRYDIMRDYMPKVGNKGLLMMHQTCTVQVNLDYSSGEDMAKKMRVGMALQGIVGSLFANSPFFEGKPTGVQSKRLHVWRDVDKNRSGLIPRVFEENFGFEDWVDYLLEVPMYFIKRDGLLHDVAGKSFADFIEGKLLGFEGDYACLDDWEEHVSVAFPDARLKRYIEMRGADAGSALGLCCLPSIWVGLLYDDSILSDSYDLVKDWSYEEVNALSERVAIEGMHANFRGQTLKRWLIDILGLASEGLKRRGIRDQEGRDERQYLENAFDLLESGKSMSDILTNKYEKEWGGNIKRIYNELRYV